MPGTEDGDAAQSGEQHDSQPGDEETSQDHREDRTSECKRIAIEAAVNLTVAFLGGVAVEACSKLLF